MNFKYPFYSFFLIIITAGNAHAQLLQRLFKVNTDTAYVSEHDNDLTIRPFTERSFNQFNFINTKSRERLTYQPNSPLQLGLGVSYRFIGVGLGFAIPGINKYEKYGKGKITDFSSHFYLRRFNVDVFYQYYGGQHLRNPEDELADYNASEVYHREDIYTKAIGVGVQYIAQPRTFSMEPFSFVHYQKKASGSFLAGVQVVRTGIYGDSLLLPVNSLTPNLLNGFPLVKSLAYNIAGNAGYAYTYVFRKHLFITGALTVGGGISFATMYRAADGGKINNAGLQLGAIYRVLTGYNSEHFFVGVQFTGYSGYQETPLDNVYQQYNIGRLNLTVAKRFKLKKKLFGFY